MIDDSLINWIALIILFLIAPIIGGIFDGLDRKITARMQNRVGPPITQPFLDFFKLVGKKELVMNKLHIVFAFAYLGFIILSVALFVFGGDLLIIVLTFGAGAFFLALGGFSVKSGFSYYGAQRHLVQMLCAEPILLLVVLSIALHPDVNTFIINEIYDSGILLAPILPLALVGLFIVLMIDMQKSPFDIATAHQEVIAGPYIEYSGKYLAITKLAHWYEIFLIFGLITLFFTHEILWISIAGKVLLDLVLFIILLAIDNATARLTVGKLFKFSYGAGISLIALNMGIIILIKYWDSIANILG